MGRMSDARKRARKAEPAPRAQDAVGKPEVRPAPKAKAIKAAEPASAGAWVAKDESFVFRQEAAERPEAEALLRQHQAELAASLKALGYETTVSTAAAAREELDAIVRGPLAIASAPVPILDFKA